MIRQCLSVSLFLSQLTIGIAEEPRFKFELTKGSDSIVAKQSEDRTILEITSESGIGGVSITPTQGAWSTQIVLRLQHQKGVGFRYLESIAIRTDRILIDSNLAESEKMSFRFLNGGEDSASNADAVSSGQMSVKAELKQDHVEITLPRYLLRGQEKVSIKWIDAFRR